MHVLRTIADLRGAREALPAGTRIGFVPTMGYLHAGHLALVGQARAECDLVVVSIFVNPTQFGPHEDLSRYPRDEARDLGLLAPAGVDWAFVPAAAEIYPPGFQTYVEVREVTTVLEGAARPGHFTGVATVVAKLFNLVQPQAAYFGQKDAQQVVVIRRMVQDLQIPVRIAVGATVREADGVALSSRNVYLDSAERQAARVLSRALTAATSAWAAGQRDGDQLRALMHGLLAAEPLAHPDYVSVADPDTLAELTTIPPHQDALVSLAVRIGRGTRLIDNVLLHDQ
ncbi:MAG TPA: pantoate--beta-alanine ligase [Chloroflexia bacterium]|nr:pantoate--beta-alanine ligase [Chloroflexia bacterium]